MATSKPVRHLTIGAGLKFVWGTQVLQEMTQRLKRKKVSAGKPEYTLMSGDRVVCTNTQYVSKVGGGKFQHQGGQVKEFTVLKVDGGIIEIEEIGTGVVSKKHESQLKLMTKVQPPNDSLASGQDVPPDVSVLLQKAARENTSVALSSCRAVWVNGEKVRVVPVAKDGQCFYRAASMNESGVLEDDDVESFIMRTKVIDHAKKWFKSAKGEELRRLRLQVRLEMKDDPRWCLAHEDDSGFDFDEYFRYQYQRSTFATSFNISAYVRMSGIPTQVFQKGYGGTLKKVLDLQGRKAGVRSLRVLLDERHYELLCVHDAGDGASNQEPDAKKRRRSGKQAEGSSAILKRPAAA